MLYLSFGATKRNIFLARPDGSDAHAILTDNPDGGAHADWSPDGSQFAFGFEKAVWTARADGSGAAMLTDGGGMCPDGIHYPNWSADGSKLAVVCYQDTDPGGGSIATFDLATKTLTPLYRVKWPEHIDDRPRWSPDGTSIAFAINHWDPTDQFLDGSLIAVVTAGGGTTHRLTTFDTFMAGPDWNPDGSEIYMGSYDIANMHSTDQPSNIYAIKPDGTGQRQVTHSSVDGTMRITQPRFTPDGTRILVTIGIAPPTSGPATVNDLQLAFVDAAGGEPVRLSPTIHGSLADLRPVP